MKFHFQNSHKKSPWSIKIKFAFAVCVISILTVITSCSGESSSEQSSVTTTQPIQMGISSVEADSTEDSTQSESIPDTESANSENAAEAEAAAYDYYEETVFQVQSMEVDYISDNAVKFTVYAEKDGEECVPRTIELKKSDGKWEVINEGY